MKQVKLIFPIILLLSSVGQVASDLYLPSLPAISYALSAHVNLVQLSVSLYMYGFACSQLIYGPLSDSLGRRSPLLTGLSILLVGSLICFFANNIYWLIIGRFLQGLGAGSGITLSRAILRDSFEGPHLAKFSAYLSVGNITIMASAPLLGGYIQYYLGWQANFAFLSLYAICCLAMIIIGLPETNQYRHENQLSLSALWNNLLSLLKSPTFICFSIIGFMIYGGVLAWLTSGPVILQTTVGLSPVEFGWLALLVGLCYAFGGILCGKLVTRFGMQKFLMLGNYLMLLAGVIMFSALAMHYINVYVVVIPVLLYILGASFVFPNAFASAITPFPNIAGIAGSLFGFTQVLGGALASTIMATLHDTHQGPLAIAFIILPILSLLTLAWQSKAKQAQHQQKLSG